MEIYTVKSRNSASLANQETEETLTEVDTKVDTLFSEAHKKQASISNHPTPMEQASGSYLDQKIDSLSKKLNEQLKNPNKSDGNIEELMRELLILLMRRDKQLETNYIFKSGLELRIQAEKIKKNFERNGNIQLTITLIAAGVAIAGGISGIAAPLAQGTTKFALEVCAKVGSASEIVSRTTGFVDLHHQGERMLLQFELDEAKRLRDLSQSTNQGNDQSIQSSKSEFNSREQSRGSTVSQLLR